MPLSSLIRQRMAPASAGYSLLAPETARTFKASGNKPPITARTPRQRPVRGVPQDLDYIEPSPRASQRSQYRSFSSSAATAGPSSFSCPLTALASHLDNVDAKKHS